MAFEPTPATTTSKGPATTPRDGGGILALRIHALRKPIIGAINGAAVGMGATMTLPMDVRLASVDARFGFPFTRRGIIPEGCSSWFLPRVVGIGTASEWMLTGRIVDASTALAAGLVRSVHASDDLLPAAHELAREISENAAPVSAAMTRQLLARMLGATDPMDAHLAESRGLASRSRSDDAAKGSNRSSRSDRPNSPGASAPTTSTCSTTEVSRSARVCELDHLLEGRAVRGPERVRDEAGREAGS